MMHCDTLGDVFAVHADTGAALAHLRIVLADGELEPKRWIVDCDDCGAELDLHYNPERCPVCGSRSLTVTEV